MEKRMLRRLFVRIACGGGLAACLLLAQNNPTPPGQVPDSVLYVAVFRHFEGTKTFADHLAAEKKDPKALRDSKRNEIGVTEAEYAAVEAIALDCLARQTANFTARGALLQQVRNQGTPATPAQTTQMNSLASTNDAQIGSHMAQVRTALGPASFAKLDQWARKVVLPTIGYKQMTKGGAK